MSMVDGRSEELDESRQLKVTVPTQTMIRLHSLKILTGKNISDHVLDALEAYFELLGEDKGEED